MTPQLRAKLVKAGFEITSEKNVVLTGVISVENLKKLARIDEVTLILPGTF